MKNLFIFGIEAVNTPIVSSTFLLTLLLMSGLFFFIRASVKNRTKKIKLISTDSQDILLTRLQEYFESRSYHIVKLDRDKKQITFEGFVRPSWFLAIFLSCLAAIGLSCFALVLSFLYPQDNNLYFLLLNAIAPIAGYFYWQKAGRTETVDLKVEALSSSDETNDRTLMTIAAHRDELIQLQQNISFKLSE